MIDCFAGVLSVLSTLQSAASGLGFFKTRQRNSRANHLNIEIADDSAVTVIDTPIQNPILVAGDLAVFVVVGANARGFHVVGDVFIAAASTTAIWTPGAGRRCILASAFVSTDTAMRVAVVDDIDAQGQRPVDGYFGANGGASPNLVPVPYVSKNPGNSIRVVTAALGNVRVRVSGWEVEG